MHQNIIAFDIEFERRSSFFPKISLLQLSYQLEHIAQIAIIDMLAGLDYSKIWQIFDDPNIVKIAHSGEQDLEIIHNAANITVNNYFDTQIASNYLDIKQQASLVDLIILFCDTEIDKEQRLSNWLKRPLSDEQISYAALDVAYLPYIYHNLRNLLDKNGYLDKICEDMVFIANKVNRDFHESILRLWNRIYHSDLPEAILTYIWRLLIWREYRARGLDIPRRYIIDNNMIIEVAFALRNQNYAQIAKSLHKNIADNFGAHKDSIINEMQEWAVNHEQQNSKLEELMVKYQLPNIPTILPNHNSQMRDMQNLRKSYARKIGIPPTILARRDDMQNFLLYRNAADGEKRYYQNNILLQGWRKKEFADLI